MFKSNEILKYLEFERKDVLNDAYTYLTNINDRKIMTDFEKIPSIFNIEKLNGSTLIEFYALVSILYEPKRIYGFKIDSVLVDYLSSLFDCGKRNVCHYLSKSKKKFMRSQDFRIKIENRAKNYFI